MLPQALGGKFKIFYEQISTSKWLYAGKKVMVKYLDLSCIKYKLVFDYYDSLKGFIR